MVMAAYRVFCVDAANHIHSVRVIEAADDDEAFKIAISLDARSSFELWQADRMIAFIPGGPPDGRG